MSPLQHRSLSDTAPSLPSLLPSPIPFPHFSVPALSRRPSASRHRPSSAPSALLSSSIVRPNKAKRRPLFDPIWPNGGPSFGHVWPNEGPWPNKGPPFDQTGPNRGPSFGPVWSNDAEREGSLGVKEDRCRKAGEERRESACAEK